MNTDRRNFIKSVTAAGTAAYLAQGSSLSAQAPSESPRFDHLPEIPWGAVYFRKSIPGPEHWAKDYKQAAKDGMNIFRHWFMWSAIEVAPGKYDWADYDAQFDLAAKHGMKTVIGEMLGTAPQWAFRKWPHARVTAADDTPQHAHYTPASAVGGWPGLCLDNDEVRDQAEKFLIAMAKRYKAHPGMGAYDVWNELNQLGDAGGCYCRASTEKFRQWLKAKYGSLEALSKAWYRYSYTSWEDVEIPRTLDPYPDSIDWALFRVDNAVRLLKWRIDVIKKIDPKNPVIAHAIPAGVLDRVGPRTYPVFQAGRLVDLYGYSGGGQHDESYKLRWKHWMNMDLIRSSSYGKTYWCGEMAAGASWNWKNRKLEEGRLSTGEDIKLYSHTHFAGGTRGILCPRWRPLRDGRFFGSFAYYNLDGSTTERSEAAAEISAWAQHPDQKGLLEAKPVKSDIAILVVPESQIINYVREESTDHYYRSISGVYQAFLFNNIQPDFVYHDEISKAQEIIYLPYPLMLRERLAKDLIEWVKNGGTLISEGCPAYFGNHGRAGLKQPNYGLNALFGVREDFVQFTPELLDDLTFTMKDGTIVKGGLNLQSYKTTTGKAVGHYEDGRIAVVDNRFGEGRTRLIGTFPGYGYRRSYDSQTKRFFSSLLHWVDKEQQVTSSDERVIARLQSGSGRNYLWAVNSSREDVTAKITISKKWGPFSRTKAHWGESAQEVSSGLSLDLKIPARDAIVLRLI